MAGDRTLLLLPAAFMILLAGSVTAAAAASASASFISVDVFEPHGSAGRSLLQATQSCPINFEFLNYTILTSQCKGPQYAASLCCAAFKEFACPYAEQINDLSNDCSSTMFSYINLYGKYPPGLFANECKEGKNGLQCDSPDTASDSTSIRISKSLFSIMVAISGLVIAFLLH